MRTVQHHHAHVAAVMAEHGLDGDAPVIGVAFDGTGYGNDGAVWGGEVLLADYKGFTPGRPPRPTCRCPAATPRVRRPYRMALAHLRAAGRGVGRRTCRRVRGLPDGRARGCCATSSRPGWAACRRRAWAGSSTPSSSLAGVRHVVDYEAQAAIELEGAVPARRGRRGALRVRPRVAATRPAPSADPAPVVRAVVADVRAGVAGRRWSPPASTPAVVDLVVDLAARCATATGLDTVALSGGVFLNALLLVGCARRAARTTASRCCATGTCRRTTAAWRWASCAASASSTG